MKTKSRLNLFPMTGLIFVVGACATHDCFNEIHNVATVRNLTGQPQSLEVCSTHSRYSQQSVTKSKIELEAIEVNTVRLPSDMEHDAQQVPAFGAAPDNCKGPEDRDSRQIQFQLSRSSFQTVQRCSHPQSSELILVNMNDTCPNGFVAQAEAASCSE